VKRRKSYLIGTDLIPLPHESTLSILWRLGWRNALNAKQIKHLCCESNNTDKKSDELLFAAWIRPSYFQAHCGWVAPSNDEALIHRVFGCAAEVWFSSTFRCCPVCLQDGYHSTWHQLLLLRTCPAHQCPIVDRCQSCGRTLEELRFTSTMFANVYQCSSCREPIAGAKISLPGHLELRGDYFSLQRAFAPFVSWAKSIEPEMAMVRDIVRNNEEWRHAWQFWARADDILMSLVPAVSEYSKNCECRPRIAFSQFTWRTDIPANKWDSMRKRSPLVIDQNRIIYSSAYRVVLRTIEEWMRKGGLEPAVIHSYASGCNSKGWLTNLDALTGIARAYIEFRKMMENDFEYSFFRFGLVEITRQPFRGSAYPRHFPRIAFRAAFLALFAAFIYAMQSMKMRRRFIASGSRNGDILPIYTESGRLDGVTTVGVIFPKADGLTSPSELRAMHSRLMTAWGDRRRLNNASAVVQPTWRQN
jgi:hypothetical protein